MTPGGRTGRRGSETGSFPYSIQGSAARVLSFAGRAVAVAYVSP